MAQAYSSAASKTPLSTASKDQSEESVVPRRHQRYRPVVATDSSTSDRVARRLCERPMISAATISAEASASCVRKSSGVTTKSVTHTAPNTAARPRGMSVDPRMPIGGPPGGEDLAGEGVEVGGDLRARRHLVHEPARGEGVAQRPVLLDHGRDDPSAQRAAQRGERVAVGASPPVESVDQP